MNLLKSIVTVSVVGVVLVAGPARAVATARQAATFGAVNAADAAAQTQIAASLKKSSLAPRDINVAVKDGVVTLTGKVRTAAEKTNAGRLAKVSGVTRVDNRIELDPKIDQSRTDAAAEKTKSGVGKAVDATGNAAKKTESAVQKGVGKSEEGVGKAADKTAEALGKGGDKLSDASITTRVKADVTSDKMLQDTAIDVTTADHVVTLRGTVASEAAKTQAGVIALRIDGVTRVVNELVVKKL